MAVWEISSSFLFNGNDMGTRNFCVEAQQLDLNFHGPLFFRFGPGESYKNYMDQCWETSRHDTFWSCCMLNCSCPGGTTPILGRQFGCNWCCHVVCQTIHAFYAFIYSWKPIKYTVHEYTLMVSTHPAGSPHPARNLLLAYYAVSRLGWNSGRRDSP